MPKAPRPFGQRNKEQARGTPAQRGYDWQWRQISLRYRRLHPVCQLCNNAAADDVDHIIAFKGLKDPLRTAWENLRSTCRACHNKKTHGKR